LRSAAPDRREGQRLLEAALEAEARGQFREAAALYAQSHALAPPDSVGRLIGMLKAAVLAGGGAQEAAVVRRELPAPGTPAAWYAIALAALIARDDARALAAAGAMRPGGAAFERAADAAAAVARDDEAGLAAACAALDTAETARVFATLAQRRRNGDADSVGYGANQ
jgi:hypothetical protein